MTTPLEEYRTIPLTQGQFALVDAADYESLMQWKWLAWRISGTQIYYAKRNVRVSKGVKRLLGMHRQIMGLELGMFDPREVDHIDRNPLNNRRNNLRICTTQQNARNRNFRANTTGYRGVQAGWKGIGFYAKLTINGKLTVLGRRETAEEAYQLYCETARRLYGEFACIDPLPNSSEQGY